MKNEIVTEGAAMITRDDIEKIHTSLAQAQLFYSLIAERDAYREVAIKIGHIYYSIITDMPGEQFVDAEAAKILSERKSKGVEK